MLVVLRPAENHFSSPSSYHQSAPTYSPYRRSHYDSDYYEFLQQRREEQEARDYAQFLYEKQQRAVAARAARERQEAIARLQAYYDHRQRQHEQAQARARLEAAAQAKARYLAIQAERQRRIAQAEAEQQQQRQRQSQQQRHKQQQQAIANHIFASIMAAITEGSEDPAQTSAPATPKPVQAAKSNVTKPTAVPVPEAVSTPKSAPAAPASSPVMTFEKAIFIAQTGLKRRLSAERHVSAVRDLKQKFDETKATFTAPSSLVFDHDKSSSSAPVLAYSSDNKAFRAYEESLTKLLVELDKVETEGSQAVRAERKALAVAIEEELTRLDDIKANAWAAQHKSTDASTVVAEEIAAPSVEEKTTLETSAAQTEEKVQDEPIAVQTEATQKHEDIANVATPFAAADVATVQAPVGVEGYTVEAPESVAARPSEAELEEPTHIEDIDIKEPARSQAEFNPNEESSAGSQTLPFAKQSSDVDNHGTDIVALSPTLSTPASPAVKADAKSTRVSDVDEDEDIEVSSESSFEMLE